MSTPQSVALADVQKGISMFRKLSIPVSYDVFIPSKHRINNPQILGIVLNQSHYICASCSSRHPLFGSPEHFLATSKRMGVDVMGMLPLVAGVSTEGDRGVPYVISSENTDAAREWKSVMKEVALEVWRRADEES